MLGEDQMADENIMLEKLQKDYRKSIECTRENCTSRPHIKEVNGEHVECDNCGGTFWSMDAFMTPIGAWCNSCKAAERG